jgi:hypothetical protein
MEGIETAQPACHQLGGSNSKHFGLRFHEGSLGQPSPDALRPPRQRVLIVLEIVRHGPDKRDLRGVTAQKSEHRLRFDADSRLRLIIKGTLQAADVQVQPHVAIIAQSGGRASARATSTASALRETGLGASVDAFLD